MTTRITEHTMYQVKCETCGGLSRFFLSMHAAERWQTTHAETHAETHTGDSELQKVNARLVWHNTQLTQELEDETVLLARMTEAWRGSQGALEKEEQAHRATVVDYIELKAGLAAAEDELNDESNARAAILAQRDEARADAEQLRAALLKAHALVRDGRVIRKKTEPAQ